MLLTIMLMSQGFTPNTDRALYTVAALVGVVVAIVIAVVLVDVFWPEKK